MAFKTVEEWAFDRKVSFENHGKYTFMGVDAKFKLERAKKKYEQELAYHNLNPSNKYTALDVKRAKENLDYWQDRFDTWD